MGLQDEGGVSTVFAMMMFCLAATMLFFAATVVQGVREDWHRGGAIFKATGVGMVAVAAVVAVTCAWVGVWMATGGLLTS